MIRKLAMLALVAGAFVALASSAEAGRRGGCRSRCGSGCGSSCYSSCYSGCGSGYYGGGCSTCYGYAGHHGHHAYAGTSSNVVVMLPAGANLTVNGTPIPSRSGQVAFQTPALEPGYTYTYSLQATMNRDGQLVTVNRDVSFQAGQPVQVNLTEAGAAVASR